MAEATSRPSEFNLALREFEFLQRLSQSAAGTVDSSELVDLIIRETTASTRTDVCSLYLVGEDPRELSLSATNGLNESMVGRVSLRVGEGITGWVAETRTPKVVSEVSKEPHWKWVPGLDEERFHSMLSVPIESGPRLVGVLNVQSVEHREFGEADVQFLRALAGQVAGILERSELQRRLEGQLKEIQLSHDIHERFTKLSLDDAGIPAILDAVGSLAGGEATLYSPDGYRVRLAIDTPDAASARIQIPAGLFSSSSTGKETRVLAGRPVKALDLVPVRAGSDVLGVLAVAVGPGSPGADPDGRRRALQHGATVLALELSKERSAAEVERRLRGDLVEELLAGGLDAEESERLAHQAERLGHRLPAPAWALVVEPDDSASEAAMSARGRQDRLDAALSDLVRRRIPGALTLIRSSSVVLLLPDDGAPDLIAAEKVAEQVQRQVATVLAPATVSVGVGNLAPTVAELARSHLEARQSLRLSRRAGSRSAVVSYRSLGAFRLLLEVQSPEALRRFVREVLGSLFRYAEARETPLLETLEALVASRWVRRAAARALGIHINSMAYRIERIESLTGLKLDDPETRVAIAIALRARAMLGM